MKYFFATILIILFRFLALSVSASPPIADLPSYIDACYDISWDASTKSNNFQYEISTDVRDKSFSILKIQHQETIMNITKDGVVLSNLSIHFNYEPTMSHIFDQSQRYER